MADWLGRMTWGEIVDALKAIAKDDDCDPKKEGVFFDFCGLAPTGEFYCDRGFYDMRSIQCGTTADYPSKMTMQEFIRLMDKEIGKKREGYKGGAYTCKKDTVATVTLEHSYSTDTYIVGVSKFYGGAILETRRIES